MTINSTLYALRSTLNLKKGIAFLIFCLGFTVNSAFGQTGTTINFDDNFACFGPITLTYSGLVAGRYHYVNTTEQLEIVFSVDKWVIRTTSGTVHFQNTTQTAPNPPRHTTYAWTSAGNGCSLQTGFAVAGTGTQTVLGSPLPVELMSFDAQNTERFKNHLTWRTASEKDNSHFDIERSTDGSTFHDIGQVKGNNKPSRYQFIDNQPFATSYYRLRQIDFDGTETVSKIVSVELKGKSKGLKIYPTLVSNGILTVNTEGGQLGDFSVTNLLGQQVLVGKTTTQIDVSSLSKGTYVLKVGIEVAKFVKQ